MTSSTSITDRANRRLRLEREKIALLSIKNSLDALRFWVPASQLSTAIGETLSVINNLEERLEAKAIVAVVGGSGAGKSTLVNALCGKDGTVEEGRNRPTTRSITALARSAGDANVLVGSLAADDIAVKQDYGFRFSDIVLVDTPDTDSSKCADYSALLDSILQQADALLCVFPAQDPKRRDNIIRLAKKVAKFKAEHIFLVLNQCDRIPEQELSEIRADFEQNIKKSWTKTGKVFLVSARASLKNSNWPESERPLHGVNEFEALCAAIRELDGSRFADRRIARAQELRLETETYVRNYIHDCGDWEGIYRTVKEFEESLSAKLVEQEAARLVSRTGDLSALLYRNVAERWHGPIGMYLHIGIFLRSIASSMRYLNPLNWAKGAISKFQGVLDGNRTQEGALLDDSLSFDWNMVKGAVLEGWPRIGPELVNRFGMSPDLIDGEKAVVFDDLEESLHRYWPQSLGMALDKIAKSKSRPIRQIALHLPLIAMAGWALFELLWSYYNKHYLPGDFYPHLCAILLLLWLLPAWLVQFRAGGSSEKIKAEMKKELVSSKISARMLPVMRDLELLKSLCNGRTSPVQAAPAPAKGLEGGETPA